ncbi:MULTISPECIES: ArsR/SmtB family transcription factor [Brevibacillus]|jgi:ArsR family transcriptional regulator, lead/cadmium/zinc/bismuth-responsive transcriptional repressor|uniref:DNA-binding transcriptional ArsR family regulator n=4 Tax=Brevibacillus TaxID=55080 RepID=A0A938Y2C1_9BACL|nr:MULTISPECIES: metalloregulator ArsR/SmtB family transcription factor [Brevibacillus]MBM7591883.1 DNA-binding transcriptional ArsR family regulator [Brevibacillus fulvus]MBR8660662.1 winged helix-turn-helix transcriptional regulator [Brevibacillus sp. NL20B1]MCG5254442.1 metalloregulator ArsR/SmtB family transcription factor [Brevibacillus agri]MDA5110529.1 metalloregulator ArsR/SmtB family transcription factor [Brevibacillus thermoruber]MDT3417407.1 DNA-binding transcriptional ArsR family r
MKEKDTCEIYCYDESKVRRVQETLGQQDIPTMAKMFKVLADETRMKIAFALCQEDELCVCDVANIIGSSMATASHHLRMLKELGLAKYRKEGKLVFYSLEDEHVRQLVQIASTHSQEVVTHGK